MSCFLALRKCIAVPRLTRSVVNRAALKPAPSPKAKIDSPTAFLTAIGRSAETKVTPETWEELWKLDRQTLKKAGLPVRDRRYILWSLEKFRQGLTPSEFAHPPQPKKKIRGRGPAVQHGKRIRSRRVR